MKHLIATCILLFALSARSQTETLQLKNVLIVALLDKPEERFMMEVNLSELMANAGVRTQASLNALKQGANINQITEDTIMAQLASKGIDTYMLVSVRGYDQKFKPAKNHQDLRGEMAIGHLFPIYRENNSSVTIEFNFYRGGQFIGYDLIKVGGVASKEDVIKKLRKKLPKRIEKKWK